MITEGTSITLVACGLILVMAEVFIPGGIAGSMGALLAAVGVIMGFTLDPLFGLILLVASFVGGIIAFWLWLKVFPKTPVGKRIILQSDARTWHGFSNENSALLGKSGMAHTPLHPSGIAVIEGKRVDVVTRGEMLDKDAPIKVVEVQGNRVVVSVDKK
jgi:membrane-bound serine protease (ClpP class)